MFELSLKISPQLVRQIATIERAVGRWEGIAESESVASEQLRTRSIMRGVQASLSLDQSTPSSAGLPRTDAFIEGSPGANLTAAYDESFELSQQAIERLYSITTGAESHAVGAAAKQSSHWRLLQQQFIATAELGLSERIVFPTLQPFLVKQRFEELLKWTTTELSQGTFHPLIVIGLFHLLFLQIHPFETANHRVAILLSWQLLRANEFDFVEYNHFAPYFSERRDEYFTALRQAEKTVRGSWATLPMWLEFFCAALQESAQRLLAFGDRRLSTERLTSVQKRILDVIRSHGPISREHIVSQTGINLSTVKYNLGVLSGRGHLMRLGGGRTTSYRLL